MWILWKMIFSVSFSYFRTQNSNSGRSRYSPQGGQHHEPHLHHHRQPRTPLLHILETRRCCKFSAIFLDGGLSSKAEPSVFLQIISYDSPRGGVSVITEKGDVTASFLVVQHAKPSDSGTYSCAPSLGDQVAVNVHVLRGKIITIYITHWGKNPLFIQKFPWFW